MPVANVCLPVSHLPSSCSFYLEVLQSFGYRFIEKKDGKVGFGPDGKADLFLSQQQRENADQGTRNDSSTVANLSFTAPSAAAIDSFATAATRAGGSVLHKPTLKDCEFGTYHATIVDLDGNKISATCSDPRMSTASYPASNATLRHDDGGSSADAASEGDGPWRITVRSQTTVPPASDAQQSSSDSTTNALVGTLLGVAAGAAITYFIGKDKKSSASGPSADSPRQTQKLQYPPRQEIEYPYTPKRDVPFPNRITNDHVASRPKMLRSATYHSGHAALPPSPDPSPPTFYHAPRSYTAPSVSEVSHGGSSHSRKDLLLIEAPSSRISERVPTYREILPPSPPSSVTSRSQANSRYRAESPSPVRSRHSMASSRRSRSASSSQKVIRQELVIASVPASRVSHTRSAASSRRSKHSHHSTKVSSEASWHSAEQKPESYKASVISRRPESVALPESRKTTVVSKRGIEYGLPESRKTSVASSSPAKYTLPESRKTSVVSRDSFKSYATREPGEYPLPESRKTSMVSGRSHKSSIAPQDVPLPISEAGRSSSSILKPRSTTSLDPRDYPLPASRKTSLASRIPEDAPLPRFEDANSRVSRSTMRPSKPPPSALGLQEDDTESLAPSDSISQIGVRKHKKKHHSSKHSDSGSKHSSSRDKDGKKRSVVSMPERESTREKDRRSVATMLRLS